MFLRDKIGKLCVNVFLSLLYSLKPGPSVVRFVCKQWVDSFYGFRIICLVTLFFWGVVAIPLESYTFLQRHSYVFCSYLKYSIQRISFCFVQEDRICWNGINFMIIKHKLIYNFVALNTFVCFKLKLIYFCILYPIDAIFPYYFCDSCSSSSFRTWRRAAGCTHSRSWVCGTLSNTKGAGGARGAR